jgi:hypothetical protein
MVKSQNQVVSEHLNESETTKLVEMMHTDNSQVSEHRLHGTVVAHRVVMQFYKTQRPDHNKWLKSDVGVVSFMKDFKLKTFFFRFYSLEVCTVLASLFEFFYLLHYMLER